MYSMCSHCSLSVSSYDALSLSHTQHTILLVSPSIFDVCLLLLLLLLLKRRSPKLVQLSRKHVWEKREREGEGGKEDGR